MSEREKRFDPGSYFSKIKKEDVYAIAQAGWKFVEDHEPSFVTRAKERARTRRRNRRIRKEVLPAVSQEIASIASSMNLLLLHSELDAVTHDRKVEGIIHSADDGRNVYILAILMLLVNPEAISEEILDEDICQLAAHFTVILASDGTHNLRFDGLK